MTPELTQAELSKKLDVINKHILETQEVNDRKYADKEQIEKISTTVTDTMQKLQDIQQAQKAQEESSKILEKAISRMHAGGKDAQRDEFVMKAKDEFTAYLRKNTTISKEVVEDISKTLARKTLIGASNEQMELLVKTLLVGQDPQGGYFVRPEMLSQMVIRIFETSPVRLVANIVTTGANGVEMIIDDDEADSGGWVGETNDRTDTATPDIGMLTIMAHEQYAQPRATQTMLDDAGFDIESWLMKKVTDKMTRTENTAFVVGDGSQKPKGFLSYDAWAVNSTFGPTGITQGVYERNKLERIKSGSANLLTADGVKNLQISLIEDYQPNAVFLMQRASFQNIITLKDAVGQYLLDPNSLKEGDDKILLGKRVIFAADMPNVAAGALPLIYGDFSLGYTIVDRIGFRVIRDNLTAKPFIKFYTTKRTGGAVTNYQCLKIQVIGA